MSIERLKELEAKASRGKLAAWTTTRGLRKTHVSMGDARYAYDFHGYREDAELWAALRNAAPATLKVLGHVKNAVEAGAIEEVYLSLIRETLKELEEAR